MDQNKLIMIVGWSSLLHSAFALTSFSALMLFFTRGGLWGTVNDALSVMWALSLIPLAGWFFQFNRQVSLSLSIAAILFGVGSMVAFAVLQFLLVFGVVRYEQTLSAIMALTGMIGLWMVLNGLMARAPGTFPPGLTLVMLVAGAGLLLSAVGFLLGGEQHPLAAAGYGIGAIAELVWPVWFARFLFSGASMTFH